MERPVETITYDRPAGSAPQRAPPAESFAHLPVNETVEIVPEAVWEDPSFYEHIGEELTFEVDLVPSLRGPSTARTRSARPPLRPPCPAPPLGLPPRRVGRPPVRATSDAFPVVPPSVGFSALAIPSFPHLRLNSHSSIALFLTSLPATPTPCPIEAPHCRRPSIQIGLTAEVPMRGVRSLIAQHGRKRERFCGSRAVVFTAARRPTPACRTSRAFPWRTVRRLRGIRGCALDPPFRSSTYQGRS